MNIVKTVKYRGVVITVSSVNSRFGILYRAENDYGEPRMGEPKAYKTVAEAIDNEKADIDQLLEDDSSKGGSVMSMDRTAIAKELVALAKDITAADTFKCPECGTKVLENTGYCLKCKKKVKASKAFNNIGDALVNLSHAFAEVQKAARGVASMGIVEGNKEIEEFGKKVMEMVTSLKNESSVFYRKI